jgi:HK97 family phage portal protein
MNLLDIFKKKGKTDAKNATVLHELGSYQARFSNIGADQWKSDVVRESIRPLASFTSKASCRSNKAAIERIMRRPNIYMSQADFLQKVRTRYELFNNCFILITKDERLNPIGFYPVPYQTFEALLYDDEIYIRFSFTEGRNLVVPWSDLAVMRKDYNSSDIAGDDNNAILQAIELLNTAEQGNSNAIKATANLRGILKNTKGMLNPDDIKRQKDAFVNDYLSLENAGGIAALDATQEFTPIKMEPVTADASQMAEYRENVYRYYGVNEKIVTSNMTPDEIEVFYEMRIEPFLNALSTELTTKLWPKNENNWVVFEANKLQFASLAKKIQMYQTVVLYGGMTVNEWREACNMSPVEGGDKMIMRLDAAPVDNQPEEEEESE